MHGAHACGRGLTAATCIHGLLCYGAVCSVHALLMAAPCMAKPQVCFLCIFTSVRIPPRHCLMFQLILPYLRNITRLIDIYQMYKSDVCTVVT